jgi:O-antigen ligase
MSSENIIKVIRYLIYGLVIIVPLIFFPTGMYPFQVVKTVVFQSLAEIIFALWLTLAIFHKEYRPKLTPLLISLIIFLIVVSLSVVFGSDWRWGLWSDEARTLGLVSLLHFVGLFVVISSLRDKINWQKLWMTSVFTASLVSLIAILGYFWPELFSFDIVFRMLQGAERAGSTFSNSAFMAGYLLFNFFIGAYLLFSHILFPAPHFLRNIKFWLLALGTILIGIAIFLSQTLGVILGLGAGIFALLVYFSIFRHRKSEGLTMSPKLNLRNISIALLVLLILSASVFWLSRDNPFWQKIPGIARLASVSFESESVRDRLIAWQIGLEAFKEKPLLGWGFENFRIAFNKYYDPKILSTSMSGTYWDKPHNILLEYLVNTGVLGLLAYLGIFAAAFYSISKNRNLISHFSFLISALIAYFIQNLFIFDTIGTYLMFFLVLAYVDSNYVVTKLKLSSNSLSEFNLAPNQSNYYLITTLLLLLITFIPIYYNYQIFNASRQEYWGVNYLLNQLPESSLVSFSRAVNTPTPYLDDIYKNFASTVKQARQQGVVYPSIAELQAKLVGYLESTIKRRPNDFFNYISLAEFKNSFYEFNPDYLKDAEDLANKALELSPKRQQVYYVLAKTKLLQADIGAAYRIFEEVIKLNPDAGDSHFYFGLMAYGNGDFKRAAEEIAIAERLGRTPQKMEEAIALANFIGDYEHNYKKAIELYKTAMYFADNLPRPNPTAKANILLKLGIAYYFDGNRDEARNNFLELQKLIDVKKLPIYPELKPVLDDLGTEK